MKMRFKIIFIALLLSKFISHSQNETSKWCFGFGSSIDFMTSPPSPNSFVNQMGSQGGCSSIADASGNLLFYTNGVNIWNASHTAMANSNGILGNGQATQSALIIKKPGSNYLYYVFIQNASLGSNNFGLYYNLIDMSLAAGQGSVTLKNIVVDLTPSTGKLVATNHCNGTDVWILIHGANSNKFKAFLLTTAGIAATPVISAIGQSGMMSTSGQMKFSPNGKKIGFLASGAVEIYDFDNASGLISNYINLGGTLFSPLGCEFSPDNTKFYSYLRPIGSHLPNEIWQWNLCAGNINNIIASKLVIDTSTAWFHGSMQLASNGKVYISDGGYIGLSVINNPNLIGVACNFASSAFPTATFNPIYQLPNFNSSLFYNYSSTPNYSIGAQVMCQNVYFSPVQTNTIPGCQASGNIPSSINWNFGEPISGASNTSTLINALHIYNSPGTYTVKAIIIHDCKNDTLSKIITVSALNPSITISGPDTICQKEWATLVANGANTYSWNNGALTNSIAVFPQFQFTYNVVGTNTVNNCTSGKTFTVNVNLCTALYVNELENNFQIFPNPAYEFINVECKISNEIFFKDFKLKITDVFGRELENQKIEVKEVFQINTSKYNEGVYFISLSNKEKIIEIKKLIIGVH